MVTTLCIGCGRCQQICPRRLPVIRQAEGFFQAAKAEECSQCRACRRVCLFEQDDFLTYSEAPWVYCGHDSCLTYRHRSASGGLTSALCSYLLSSGCVQGIVNVNYFAGRFNYVITQSIDQLHSRRGSAYAPVFHNQIWDQIRQFNGQLAFIGTPCWCEAVALAKSQDRVLHGKVKFVLSLVCGHMPSADMSLRYFRNLVGQEIAWNDIHDLRYRGDGWPGKGLLTLQNGTTHGFNHTHIWNTQYLSSFTTYSGACMVCRDLWGSCADAGFGDYWSEDLSQREGGESLVSVRSKELVEILQSMARAGTIVLSQIDWTAAIRSQRIPHYLKTTVNPRIKGHIMGTNRSLLTSLYLNLLGYMRTVPGGSVQWRMLNGLLWRVLVSIGGRISASLHHQPL